MLKDKIMKLKGEKDVVILAHNYQIPEVQDIADFVGDSLGLARQAAKTNNKTILFKNVNYKDDNNEIEINNFSSFGKKLEATIVEIVQAFGFTNWNNAAS